MPRSPITTATAILATALLCGGCGPAAPTGEPAPAAATRPPAADTTPASGAVRYACGDGSSVTVAYGDDQARVDLPDGLTLALRKAQSASKGGGEVFVGDTVSLEREGEAIALFQGEGERLDCRPSDASE